MKYFDYDNINLIPKKCIVNSRSQCNTALQFGAHNFKLPVVPANMECVINYDIACKLASNGYFYIYHRFENDILEFSKLMKNKNLPISISIGVNNDAYDIIKKLISNNIIPDYITIDIAHGHSIKMKNIIEYINTTFRSSLSKPFIIAGNVSTPEAVIDLELWGAKAIKVGIGPGSACTTYNATGFGSRGAQASIVEECAKARTKKETLIIADGGIKEYGDITKSLVLGANMVMVGGLFSALTDSPGGIVKGVDGLYYKEFWGSASSYQNNKKNRIEGTKKLLLMKPHSFLDEMKSITEALESSISYGGGNDIYSLKNVSYFLK
jgi:GMP reductase